MELSEAEENAVSTIRAAKAAWVPRAILPEDALESLTDRGILTEWVTPEGVMVTFTAIGAEEFGIDLVERYKFGKVKIKDREIRAATEIPKWVVRATLDPSVPKRRKLKTPRFVPAVLPIFEEPPRPKGKQKVPAKDPATGEDLAIRFGMKKPLDPIMVGGREVRGGITRQPHSKQIEVTVMVDDRIKKGKA